jgi:hypothetical protein
VARGRRVRGTSRARGGDRRGPGHLLGEEPHQKGQLGGEHERARRGALRPPPRAASVSPPIQREQRGRGRRCPDYAHSAERSSSTASNGGTRTRAAPL